MSGNPSDEQKPPAKVTWVSLALDVVWVAAVYIVVIRTDWDSPLLFLLVFYAMMATYWMLSIVLQMGTTGMRPRLKHLCVLLMIMGMVAGGYWFSGLGGPYWGAPLVVLGAAAMWGWADVRSRKKPPKAMSLEELERERNAALVVALLLAVIVGVPLVSSLVSSSPFPASVEGIVTWIPHILVMTVLAAGAWGYYALIVFKIDLLKSQNLSKDPERQGEAGQVSETSAEQPELPKDSTKEN